MDSGLQNLKRSFHRAGIASAKQTRHFGLSERHPTQGQNMLLRPRRNRGKRGFELNRIGEASSMQKRWIKGKNAHIIRSYTEFQYNFDPHEII